MTQRLLQNINPITAPELLDIEALKSDQLTEVQRSNEVMKCMCTALITVARDVTDLFSVTFPDRVRANTSLALCRVSQEDGTSSAMCIALIDDNPELDAVNLLVITRHDDDRLRDCIQHAWVTCGGTFHCTDIDLSRSIREAQYRYSLGGTWRDINWEDIEKDVLADMYIYGAEELVVPPSLTKDEEALKKHMGRVATAILTAYDKYFKEYGLSYYSANGRRYIGLFDCDYERKLVYIGVGDVETDKDEAAPFVAVENDGHTKIAYAIPRILVLNPDKDTSYTDEQVEAIKKAWEHVGGNIPLNVVLDPSVSNEMAGVVALMKLAADEAKKTPEE